MLLRGVFSASSSGKSVNNRFARFLLLYEQYTKARSIPYIAVVHYAVSRCNSLYAPATMCFIYYTFSVHILHVNETFASSHSIPYL